jgi:hypothetical protein
MQVSLTANTHLNAGCSAPNGRNYDLVVNAVVFPHVADANEEEEHAEHAVKNDFQQYLERHDMG